DDAAPYLSVFGGKITTHRKLAEEALDWLAPALGNAHAAWTAADDVRLPGADFAARGFDALLHEIVQQHPWLPGGVALRYARSYGTRLQRILGGARALQDLGEHFGAGLHAAEVDYLVREEWARDADDILWRRSKLGLRIDASGHARLQAYLA